MLPIHAFAAEIECPAGVKADDQFAAVGGEFMAWVEAAFAEDVPGFQLFDGEVEPIPGHRIEVRTDRADTAHERFRMTWRQPWWLDGAECVQEYSVARAGKRVAASVTWFLTSDRPLPPDLEVIRPGVLTRLLPLTGCNTPQVIHPLDGLARGRDDVFRAVEAALDRPRAEKAARDALKAEQDALLFAEMEADNLDLARQRDALKLEVADLAETIFELKAENESLKSRLRSGRRTPDEPPPSDAQPRSVTDVVERIRREFPNELVFLKSADDSAADSPYEYPEKAYHLLHTLGDITRRWRTNTLNGDWFAAFLEADPSFVYKPHISQTTATRHRADYSFQYDGSKRLFEPHVTLGRSQDPKKCLSVHWIKDDDAKQVIVGWCGRHLPNTKT